MLWALSPVRLSLKSLLNTQFFRMNQTSTNSFQFTSSSMNFFAFTRESRDFHGVKRILLHLNCKFQFSVCACSHILKLLHLNEWMIQNGYYPIWWYCTVLSLPLSLIKIHAKPFKYVVKITSTKRFKTLQVFIVFKAAMHGGYAWGSFLFCGDNWLR